MVHSKIFPAALLAALALGVASPAFAHSGEKENRQEIAALLAAKTSVSQAIAAAEARTQGRAIKVGLETKKGVRLYEVRTLSKDAVVDVHVDMTSGKVVRVFRRGLISKVFDREEREGASKLGTSAVSLANAVQTAERHVNGKAVEASFENEDGALLFEVEVVKAGVVHKVNIDAASGKVDTATTSAHGDED